MELGPKNDQKMYLFVTCNTDDLKNEAFIAVTKAMLYSNVAIEMENLGDYAILIISSLPIKKIDEKLKRSKVHYILIDLSLAYDLESVLGFLPDSKLELIKNITANVFSPEKTHLKKALKEAVQNENYELAAPIRDLTNTKKNKNEK